ncbi:DMT family transporter [Aquisalibacillus elongatus]|uniref:Drug/metabolite transporter (DMT)-like permease n=1 Tax=Aquisalibacillus elongatus TaxID=485577 RepID=A0A3N5AZS6_9BACI|nr:DMT family transporter [Aquisalibacillus elongatus]RPF50584.1 drug/metabolite transporter (DMT)-like permease [Aquisalibacillus elongatus]
MFRSYIFLIITVMIFSGNLIVGKAINDLPPVTIAFVRTLIAFLVILPFGYKQLRQSYDVLKDNIKPLIAIALTGITTFNVLVYLSLNFTTSTNAGIVEASTPAYAMILGYFILKEKLKPRHIIGTVISFIGALWVLTQGSIERLLQLEFNIGDITMVIAMIVWACYTLIVKQHNHKFPIFGGTLAMIGLGVIILIPTVIVEWMILGFPTEITNSANWLGLLYLGIFPSFIAFVLWNQAVSDLGPSLSSVFLNILPFFTTIGAVIFLNEQVFSAQIIGGVLVILGVIMVNVNLKEIFRKKELTNVDEEKVS